MTAYLVAHMSGKFAGGDGPGGRPCRPPRPFCYGLSIRGWRLTPKPRSCGSRIKETAQPPLQVRIVRWKQEWRLRTLQCPAGCGGQPANCHHRSGQQAAYSSYQTGDGSGGGSSRPTALLSMKFSAGTTKPNRLLVSNCRCVIPFPFCRGQGSRQAKRGHRLWIRTTSAGG